MPAMQKTWVGFNKFFRTAHHELLETTYLNVQDAGMHHANMVHDVLTGIQEVLQQENCPVEVPAFVQEPHVNHVANAVKCNRSSLPLSSRRCMP